MVERTAWTEADNQRRGDLIDRKYAVGLTVAETAELADLQARMIEERQEAAGSSMVAHYHHTIQGWMDADFKAVYREAVARTPDGGCLVEVGCWKGKSLCFLLVEAARSGKRLWISGVDHWRGSVGEPLLLAEARARDLEAECKRNCDRAGYHYKLFRRHSPEAAAGCRDEGYDFIFLDGSHDYRSVAEDIEAWLPKVKPGGILAGHDLQAPGVARAVAELLPGAQARGTCWWHKVGEVARGGL